MARFRLGAVLNPSERRNLLKAVSLFTFMPLAVISASKGEAMRTCYSVALAMIAGFGLGAIAVHGLHAQTRAPVYVVTEIDVTDNEAYMKEYVPRAVQTVRDAGGYWIVRGGKAQTLQGEPPKRVIITAWDSIEKIRAWQNSAAWQEIQPIRAKLSKSSRSFAVEGF
jgi:uncharacterized protein (DUF1330 family)